MSWFSVELCPDAVRIPMALCLDSLATEGEGEVGG